MKAEINSENKKKFFALYAGQRVLADNLRSNERLDQSWNWSHPDFWLNLKPLSQISDEDAIEVAKMLDWFALDFEENHLDQFKKHFLNQALEWDHYGIYTSLIVIDFLRSRGYALPWMGLSVEELIAAGWVKLTEV